MLRIVFFGTAQFAVPALRALLDAPDRFSVVAVVTQPDRPAGRRGELRACPVAELARERGCTLLQPEKLKTDEFADAIAAAKPDLIVTASYGRIVPQRVLDIPRVAPLNLHGSLLPKYRGASPIQAAILEGETGTGVSLMVMDDQVDHGPVIATAACPIAADDNHDTLEVKLGDVAASLLIAHAEAFADGREKAVEQVHEDATFCGLIDKKDGEIRFASLDAVRAERMTRAYAPWPGAYFVGERDGAPIRVKVLRAQVAEDLPDGIPGTLSFPASGGAAVQCARGSLVLLEVQPEGKKAMTGESFANGYRGCMTVRA